MKKIILYGGSFDPIHKGHILIAQKALKLIKANSLFFIPCYKSNDKKKLSKPNLRLEMLKMCLDNFLKLKILDYELKQKKISYTIDLINWFLSYNNYRDELYILIGQDQYNNFHFWKDYQKILDKVTVIVYPRSTNIIVENKELNSYKNKFIFMNSARILKISSSQMRLKPLKKYLDQKIINFINQHGLYATDRLKAKVSNYRYKHSINVKNIGIRIGKSLNLSKNDLDKIFVACIYHDYCKEMSEKEILKIAKKLNIIDFPSWKVLHGYVAAYYVKKLFFIDDEVILKAIENHTIIKNNNLISKIVFASDKMDIRKDWKIKNYDYLMKNIFENFEQSFIEIKKIVESEH